VSYTAARRKPNWVLRGFLIVSVLIHLLVMLKVSGLFAYEPDLKIEVSLFEQRSAPRAMPRPRPRPPEPPPTDDIRPVEKLPPMLALPAPSARPETSNAGPDTIAAEAAVALPAGALGGRLPSAAMAAVDPSIYYDLVRQRIDRHKRYPAQARKRQIQGKVVLQFTLSPQGDLRAVRVVTSSRNPELDQAALDAVKRAAPYPPPPRASAQEGLSMELAIFFELS
jgi:protein TonB